MLRLLLVLFVMLTTQGSGRADQNGGKTYISGHESSSITATAKVSKSSISRSNKSAAKIKAANRARLAARNTEIRINTAKAPKVYRVRTNKRKKAKAKVIAEKKEANEANLVKANSKLSSLELKSVKPSKVIAVKEDVSTDYEEVQELSALDTVGPFTTFNQAHYFEVKHDGSKSILTLDRDMQEYAEDLLKQNRVPWGAVIALDPRTGAIRSLAGFSDVESNGQAMATRNTFPAASLFKIVTAAAAVETSGYSGGTEVSFRGGTYTLGKQNYLPNKKTDTRKMSFGLAMAKSCNPVFARVALNDLSTDVIRQYANNFGFNKNLAKDFTLKPSTLDIDTDSYSLARTAAGFGSAFISPVHAGVIAGAVGNKGIMMRPYITDHLNDRSGRVISKTQPEVVGRSVSASTASELLDMMSITISEGTARKHFKNASSDLKSISVAAKTGTLSGKNPKGLYHWFVAVAPVENPRIAIATLVIDNGRSRIGGVGLGKKYLERYFANEHSSEQANSLPVEKLKEKKPLS